MEYQLELKQIVDFPRCRIYRNFIQTLLNDRSIRTTGGSFLFWYLILCSYANYSTSNRRMEQLTYTLSPGEWICSISELQDWFRCRFQHQAVSILAHLQEEGCITSSLLEKKRLVRFRITDWQKDNTALEYHYPCKKDTGFFFFPIGKAHKLIQAGKCSEMDIILDLWISAVYNDERVQGSFTGPVAYFRNGTGCPLVSYAELAQRWGMSKATAGRTLKKLSRLGYISLLTFPGRHGTAIYLQNYLSTMFQISDVMVDKEEVAMSLNIKMTTVKSAGTEQIEDHACGSEQEIIVSKPDLDAMALKVLKVLALQGVACSQCHHCTYKLYPLSGDCLGVVDGDILQYRKFHMDVFCGGTLAYAFELSTTTVNDVKICEGGLIDG